MAGKGSKVTGTKAVSEAGKVLAGSKSAKAAKSAAGSALSQTEKKRE